MSRQLDPDDIPFRESINPAKRFGPHWYKGDDGKNRRKNGHIEELLDAIKRKLISSIGRHWNDVYSEIKPQLPERRRHGTYLDWFVELNCFTQDGKIYTCQGRELSSHYRDQLYVAEDGILKLVPHKSHKRKKPTKTILELDKKKYYRKAGIWWEVETQPNKASWNSFIDGGKYGRIGLGEVRDVFYGFLTSWEACRKYGEAVNIVKKQQCGKRTCKKLNALCAEKRQTE